MTRVSFYVLKTANVDERQAFACRLAEKAYSQGHQIYIHANSADEAQQLDQALWQFRADSFIPHEIMSTEQSNDSPVLIGHDTSPPRLMDVLINLADEQPLFFSQFERVAEVIDANEHIKQAGRTRYQFYKHRGYQLESHNI
jgi:DNA polymerase-3 subunit chi